MAINVTSTKNALAQAFADLVEYISLHTGNPGSSGSPSNEVTGGSPAYARKVPSWGSPSGGVIAADELEFDVPVGTTVTHVGYLDGDGNLVDWADSADVSFTSAQGKLRVTPKYTQS